MRFTLAAVAFLTACAPENLVLGRPYELKVPTGDDGQTALPLLILAHGYGVNGVGQDFLFPFSKQVDGKRFLYAEPHGTQDREGRRFWNATDQCCNFENLPVDDVAFFRALVDDIKTRHPVKSVFVVGHSNGGFMALRLLCDAPDMLDGVVAVSASTWNDPTRCPEGEAVPLLLVHGTDDGTIPYEGRPDRYPGAWETATRFSNRAGCSGQVWTELEPADFLSAIPGAETRRERAWTCPPGAAVELWTMVGEGHAPQFEAPWTQATFDWLEAHAP